jgi:hypothetical protein
VACVITSPPFQTDVDAPNPFGYINRGRGSPRSAGYLLDFTVLEMELSRVISPNGTCWLVLGGLFPWTILQQWATWSWIVAKVSVWDTSVVAQLHYPWGPQWSRRQARRGSCSRRIPGSSWRLPPRRPAAPRDVSDPYAGVVTDQPYTPLARRFVRECLTSSTSPGDLVLDPCCGTGTVTAEAKALHRRFIGIEIDPDSCAFARARTSGS